MKSGIILTIDKKDQELLKDCIDDLASVTGSLEIKQGNFAIEFL